VRYQAALHPEQLNTSTNQEAQQFPTPEMVSKILTTPNRLLSNFIASRRQGISPRTVEFYKYCLSTFVNSYEITTDGINSFLADLKCGNAKLNYYRAITVFVHWLIRIGYLKENPLDRVDKPKPTKKILPRVTTIEVETLIDRVSNTRDEAIISLLADSGMRLSDLANIKTSDINWDTSTITIIGKGNKQWRAPFTEKSAKLLQLYFADNHNSNGNIWGIKR